MRHGLRRVTQAHVDARLLVERIRHARIARLFVIVADDDAPGLVHVQNGHAVDGRALGRVGRRVHHVVGAHDEHKVGLGKERIHHIHLEQMLVLHIGLGQEHVHVPGHAPRHRMDGVVHRGAVGLQRVGKLLDLVLRLRQRHAVARHDDHPSGRVQQLRKRGVVIACRRVAAVRGRRHIAPDEIHQMGHGLRRIAQAHVDAGFLVERVRHAGIARLFVIVADDDAPGLVHVQNGHAVDGRALGRVGRRVHHVVGAHDEHKVGLGKERIHHIHLEQMLVLHIGLGQEHVHVPGHAPRHRMDGVVHRGAVGLQRVGKLLDLVLRLRQRHAVARHDDHPSGRVQQLRKRGIVIVIGGGRAGSGGPGRPGGRRWRRRRGSGRGGAGLPAGHRGLAQQDGHEPPVHGLAHDAREHVARRADDAAHGDEQRVGHGKARDGAGDAAHGVEQGNGDGHVRPAHAQGEHDAEERAGGEHESNHEPGQKTGGDIVDAEGHQHQAQQEVDDAAVIGQHDGPLRQHLVQLARGHEGTGNGGHARAEGQAGVDAVEGRLRTHIHQHDESHQGGGAAAEAVEKGHELRHLDHLDLVGEEESEGHAHGNGDPEVDGTKGIVAEHGDDNSQGHGPGGNGIAPDGGLDVAHQVQAVEDGNSEHRGNDVVIERAHARSFSLASGGGRGRTGPSASCRRSS